MEGTTPRTIKELYRVTEAQSARFQYTISASMLELYRNDLVDLLSKGNPKAGKKLNIKTDKQGRIQVENVIEEECRNVDELTAVLERGNEQRSVAATQMNSESSRSHLVFMVKVLGVNKDTGEQSRGKILMCDLAGSERLKKSGATDEMQKEAIEINKSLTVLGDVIEALTSNQKIIPYRNHKLTQLMQDSLGGTAKTLMFVNCSPASSNLDETLMSLKYATRAKKITNTTKKGT
uniref:Kinesin motor domain-containing protein n=1 Tax=Zooxanthella nutricula TaxID=1333877 RepID=A0A7S2PCH0_9DINO